jgi:hypothetical protein
MRYLIPDPLPSESKHFHVPADRTPFCQSRVAQHLQPRKWRTMIRPPECGIRRTRHLIPGQSLAFFTQVKLAPLTSFPAQYSESSWWGRQTRSARESKVNIDSVGIITGKLRSLLPIGSTKESHGGERQLFPFLGRSE